MPFSVADFQRVVLAGAVGVARQMHQILRVAKLQVGQQVHLLRRLQGFFCNVGHRASLNLICAKQPQTNCDRLKKIFI